MWFIMLFARHDTPEKNVESIGPEDKAARVRPHGASIERLQRWAEWLRGCTRKNASKSGRPVGRRWGAAHEGASMNPLLNLKEHGQSVWLDDIHHRLLTDGRLNRPIEEDGLNGVTSNRTVFKRAIRGSDYDNTLSALLTRTPTSDARRLYDSLVIE